MRYELVVFDLDGTLYEDPRVYNRYARELSRFLPTGKRAAYLADWRAARAGRGAAQVGMGYDRGRDRLFRFVNETISDLVAWEDADLPIEEQAFSITETPLFAGERIFIGDYWGLPDALAAHHGIRQEDRGAAFLATRVWMSGDHYILKVVPRLGETLDLLREAGARLAALSNSPADTVEDILRRLGVRDRFASVVASAHKPEGLICFLREHGAGEHVLCAGDHYVNEIASALRLGCHALYIDRHRTGLGADNPACSRVKSIGEALAWLRGCAAESGVRRLGYGRKSADNG